MVMPLDWTESSLSPSRVSEEIHNGNSDFMNISAMALLNNGWSLKNVMQWQPLTCGAQRGTYMHKYALEYYMGKSYKLLVCVQAHTRACESMCANKMPKLLVTGTFVFIFLWHMSTWWGKIHSFHGANIIYHRKQFFLNFHPVKSLG